MTFSTDHVLVQKILGMWKVLNIRGGRVPQVGNVDRHHEILRNWSKVIQGGKGRDDLIIARLISTRGCFMMTPIPIS